MIVLAVVVAGNDHAATYNVNRSFTDGSSFATLTGTLDIPFGSYTIQNSGPSPFTSVNLTLTDHATSYHLSYALTTLIHGTGQFFVDATPTTLTFSVANANGSNPADLVFSDHTDASLNNRYVIGFNGIPGFEAAYADAGSVATSATLPTAFAVVPEPTAGALAGLFFLGHFALRGSRNRRNPSAS